MTDREATDLTPSAAPAAPRQRIRAWMDAYRRAWSSNEPDDIRALFTDDAAYRTDPWLEPVVGPDAIVALWRTRGDEAGTFTFRWEVAGIDGDRAFVEGETRYDEGRVYSNLWVIDLSDDGRARSFTEWWMDQADAS